MTPADFEAIWSSLPVPAIVVSSDHKVLALNPAAESFVGLSSRQATGFGLATFIGPTSRVLDVLRQAAEQSLSVVQYDVALAWQDKSLGSGTVQATRMTDKSDLLLLLTPRGLAEKMDRSLGFRSAARSVTGMAAMLAHEIRNPLAGISGAAQLLAMNLNDEDRDIAALIEAEAARIGDLVTRVEQFGDQGPVSRDPINIHDVLDRSVRAARAGFAAHARIRDAYDPSLPETIGDADQLTQVFQNLLKNAAEAVPTSGGAIHVQTAFRPGVRLTVPGARSSGLPLEVTISDNGRGIPADLIEDIFDPFVSTKAGGTGLGLSLVSRIIAGHGGVVDCDCGGGRTTFRVLLPIWNGPKKGN